MYYFNFKKHLTLSLFVFAGLVAFVFSLNYFHKHNKNNIKASGFENTKIAVLDGEKLKNSAKCFNSHEKIGKMITDVLSRMKKSEYEIKSEYEKIRNDSKLSQKQKLKEISKIEAKWANISAKYNSEIQSIKNTDTKLSNYIQKKLDRVIDVIARSLKLNLILNKGTRESIAIFYNSKNIDITDLVIEKLDETVTDISLNEVQK